MLRTLLFVFALAAAGLAAAQEVAFTNRATDLKDQASSDARTLASLREGTQLKVTQRASGWARVEAGGQSGWIRIFHLRFPVSAETTSGSSGVSGALSSLTSAISGRQTTQKATIATTGIRGLSPEDLKNASPDAEALRQVQSWRADKAAAERFAREGKLTPATIAYEGSR